MSNTRDNAINAVEELKNRINEKWNHAKYTMSIVAFIDVMGTSELFTGNPYDFDSHKATYKEWDEIVNRQELIEYKNRISELYGAFDVKSTVMSDSVVLSVDASVPDAFPKLFMVLSLFANSLLPLNPPRFLRGAVAVGNIYHEDNIVFGPALVEASAMEKNEAKSFRIITKVSDYDEAFHKLGDDYKDFMVAYFRLDKDGYYYFDYLYRFYYSIENWVQSGKSSDEYLRILSSVQKKIRHEAKNNPNKSVKKKYVWMDQYFNVTMNLVMNHSNEDSFLWLKEAYNEWRRGES